MGVGARGGLQPLPIFLPLPLRPPTSSRLASLHLRHPATVPGFLRRCLFTVWPPASGCGSALSSRPHGDASPPLFRRCDSPFKLQHAEAVARALRYRLDACEVESPFRGKGKRKRGRNARSHRYQIQIEQREAAAAAS